jgi:hypothetical protein
MRLKHTLLPILTATVTLSLQLANAPGHLHAAQQDLPPVSYVCPMPADAEVLETKPGNCPVCGMELIPVRIDSAWSCPNHAAVIRDNPGTCPIDKRELVPVVVAKHWSCPDNPNKYLGDPGKCADGSERKLVTELRAHGDHNPRHGGSFFMAEDKWHHLEGTYPSAGLVRMFFYDNFTKPLPPKAFTGRVVLEENGKETASFPLVASRNGQTLEAQIKGAPSQLSAQAPFRVAALIKFDQKTREQRFDFTFPEFSKEPPVAPAATTTRNAAPAAPAPATRNAAPAAPPATRTAAPAAAPPAPAAAAPAAPAVSVPSAPTLSQTATSATMSRADAEILAENLPSSPAELVKLLEQRAGEVNQAIQDGQYGYVYIPTMLSKDIALAIDDHVSALPDQKRAEASAAVRRLVLASWELDLYGDLGNREKITNAYNSFAAAVADIKASYASSR